MKEIKYQVRSHFLSLVFAANRVKSFPTVMLRLFSGNKLPFAPASCARQPIVYFLLPSADLMVFA